jgi:N-acyl-L-homoserine lactone synthetase
MSPAQLTDLSLETSERSLRLFHVREGAERLHLSGALAVERLRADEYIDRRGWIEPTQRNADGGETDQFDDVASHFAVLTRDLDGTNAAVGGVRLVRPLNGVLPIHTSFPALAGLHDGYIEVSRYIARDSAASLALRAVIVAELRQAGARGIAIISDGLRKLLTRQSFIVHTIAGPEVIETYGRRPQVAIEVDVQACAAQPILSELVELAADRRWSDLITTATGVTQ